MRRRAQPLALLLAAPLAGCGLVLDLSSRGEDAGSAGPEAGMPDSGVRLDAETADAGGEDAGGADADVAPPDSGTPVRCDSASWLPFEGPELLAPLNVEGADEESPRPSPDGLTLWFVSNRGGGGLQPFYARRADPDRLFDSPAAWPSAEPAWFSVMGDERPLLRALNPAEGCARIELWDGLGEVWRPGWAPGSASNDYNPWVSADGLRLYFASTRDDELSACGTGERLYRSARASASEPFPPAERFDPSLAVALGPDDAVANPTLTGDELTLVFNVSRPGEGSRAYYARRPNRDEPFGPAIRVPFVTEQDRLQHPGIGPTGCELFAELFQAGGHRDLVRFTQPR